MKRYEKFTKQRNTLVYQVTFWYVCSFIAVLFLIGLVVLGAVSYFLLEGSREEQQLLENELVELAEEEDRDELQEELDSLLYPEHADYSIEISLAGDVLARSRGFEELDESEQDMQLLWLDQFTLRERDDLFYSRLVPWEDSGEEGIIEIRVELENEMDFFLLLIQILFYTGLFSLLIGSFLIYRLTKKSLQPLLVITDAVGKIKVSGDLKERVPVPEKPVELVELAAAFNQSLDRIEEQFEREKSFVSNASHELRTPLTAFRGHLKLLKRWGRNDPAVLDQSIEAMDHESGRMERMMLQLLMIARNEHMERKQEPVNLTLLTEHVMEQFPAGDITEIKAELERDVFVTGDEEQLRQVIVILLENAVRYTMEGYILLRLTEDKDVRLHVIDTGIGIPKEEQPKIFDRFYRVDKDRARKSGGTGLGLSIAKDLIQNHYGILGVDSEPGRGSTFTIILPKPRTGI